MALSDDFDYRQFVIDGFNRIVCNPNAKKKDRERSQFLLGCIYGYETYVDENYDPNAVINSQKRRARIRKLENTMSADEWKVILKDFDNSCAYCGATKQRLSQDHFIPVMSGGGYTKSNIIPSCKSCNSSKNDRGFFDWFKNRDYCNAESVYKIFYFVG